MRGADNALVTPQVFSLPRAIDTRTQDRQQLQMKMLPCTVTAVEGEMVTVNFEIQSGFTLPKSTIPQAFSAWVRLPTQVGDKGVAIAADYYLGGQSGQGSGTANLYQRGNLTPLFFIPITTTSMSARNLDAALVQGPQGAVMQDTTGAHTATVDPSKGVALASTKNVTHTAGNKVALQSGTTTAQDQNLKDAIKAKAQADLVANPSAQSVSMSTTLPSGSTYNYTVSRN